MTRSFCFKPAGVRCLWGAAVWFFLAFSAFRVLAQDIPPRRFSVQITATVQESPPRITLDWINEGDANSYIISRRTLDSGWQQLGTVAGGETSFADGNVGVGIPYEYQAVKTTSRTNNGYGYLRAGIRVPATENRGKILLLVENTPAAALGSELARLQRDLVADGWVVIRRDVSMNDSPPSVKDQIRSVYNLDPVNTKALFLFGHIPVPYSGNIVPDGHANHKGAWPADVYYGEMDGNWTDRSVNSITAEREANRNIPGDGKFDQSEIPGDVELMVGRVDLHNMTCYANKTNSRSEIDLLRQYLDKNHAFRIGDISVERRALICDNFGDKGRDPIAGSAWRTFPGTVGRDIQEVSWDGYLPAASAGSYLWSYASGGGSYYYSTGVATSDDFALQDVKVVFAMFMGSYFGDWNNESNFLRAALGSGYVLTSSYSGFPHTLYFAMGLGEPIGYCIRLSQNNRSDGLYPPWGQGTHQVHVALHGDPTLRLHPVKPPSGLNANPSPRRVNLTWGASLDSNLQGYHLYRSAGAEGPFTRITQQPVSGTSLSDTPLPGNYTYMVRAIKLEQTPGGTYLNPSLGTFVTATVPGGVLQPPAAPVLRAEVISHAQVNLQWEDLPNETSYKIQRRTTTNWTDLNSPGANTTSFSDQDLLPSTAYSYRMLALNDAGLSPFSSEVPVTTPAAPQPQSTVVFVEQDTNTLGNWPQKFGRDGSAIADGVASLPFDANFNGAQTFAWGNRNDPRGLLTTATSTARSYSAWFADALKLDLSVGDTTNRIALYMVDWDAERTQTVTVTDTATGMVMDTRAVGSLAGGVYLVYDVRGNVRVTIDKTAGANAILQGIFVGGAVPPPVSNKPLQLTARGGAPNSLLITISGDSGQRFRLESSQDFRSWSEVTAGTLATTTAEIQVPRDLARLYLRTVNMP